MHGVMLDAFLYKNIKMILSYGRIGLDPYGSNDINVYQGIRTTTKNRLSLTTYTFLYTGTCGTWCTCGTCTYVCTYLLITSTCVLVPPVNTVTQKSFNLYLYLYT